ncbi:MAG: TolC family protein [Bacteroides sp.]|nr:TolC family protein [Bacteroides sp.]
MMLLVGAFLVAFTTHAQNGGVVTLTLDEALEIALSENPTIKIADQEIQLRKEVKREAYYNLIPELSLNGNYSRTLKKQTMVMDFGGESQTLKVGSDNSYSGGLTISLPIFAPALYKTINLTQTDIEMAVEQARSSKLELVNQVTKAYYQLLLAQDSYDVLLHSYRNAETNFNIVNAKYEQGAVSEYDKIRADVQMRSLWPSVVSAQNGINLAKLQLKVLIGIDPELDLSVLGNLKDYELSLFENQLNNEYLTLNNNTSLKQLDINAELLKNTLQLQRTNFLPTLGASFNYSYTSLNNDFRIAHYKWYPYSTVGLSLNIPLFKASDYSKTKQTRIQMLQLAENRAYAEKQLKVQATSYLDNMAASSEQVLSNKESVFQAEKGRDIAQKLYEVGKGTILELNDSEVALTQTQLTYN